MQSAFIINDRTGKPYAVVGLLAGGTEFFPIAESAVSWSSWMTQDFADRKITKEQLVVTLDNSMTVEGPITTNRANKQKIDELIKKAKRVPTAESDKLEKEEKSLVPILSIMDIRLDSLENSDWNNAVNFKAKSLLSDSTKSTFAYEVKRTRATWDPGLSVPGTDRRGGWRCPPGTRYGGQITDRFGRNCGWGVARRLANEIADLGERVENIDDRRRERRVNRRNERVARRLREGGRVERAARAIGDALETPKPQERQPGVVERAAGRVGDLLESNRPRRQRRGQERGGIIERAAGRLANALESDQNNRPAPRRPRPTAQQVRPARPRQPRRPREDRDIPNLPNFNPNDIVGNRQKYLEQLKRELEQQKRDAKRNRPDGVSNKDWNDYKAHVDSLQHQFGYGGADRLVSVDSYEDWARKNNRKVPDAAAQPQVPAQPRGLDNISGTPVPAGPPKADETLEQYKRRKYNEHQARVRKIREDGGNAGFLRYEEWEGFHGQAVQENWNRAQERNRGRNARRIATDAGAARTATRRPKPDDAPEQVQPPRRQRRPFRAENPRGSASEAAARRRRAEIEQNDSGNAEYKIVKHNDKYFVVKKEEVDRANANGANLEVVNEAPRPARRQRPQANVQNLTPPSPGAQQRTPSVRTPRKRRAPDSQGANALTNDNRLGPVGKDGLPGWGGIPVGNKNINTKDDAARHLENGGDIADIPDDFVIDALVANSGPGKRFSRRESGGGINGMAAGNMYLYTDSTNGKQYYTKYERKRVATGEEIREILGNNIAARLGFPVGEFRYAGAIRRDSHGELRPILFEHAANYIAGDYKNGESTNVRNLLPEEKVKATVLDYLILNVDRHRSNFFVVKQGNEHRFVPIDPSLGFSPDAGYGNFQGPYNNRSGLRQWINHHRGGGRNAMIGTLRDDLQNGRVQRAEVIQTIERLQRNMREAQDRLAFEDFARGAQGAVPGNSEQEKLIENPQKRIDFFVSQSASSIADIILGV